MSNNIIKTYTKEEKIKNKIWLKEKKRKKRKTPYYGSILPNYLQARAGHPKAFYSFTISSFILHFVLIIKFSVILFNE